MTEVFEDWISVKSSLSRQSILESDLVLKSMEIETRIELKRFEYRLLTKATDASRARMYLELYYRENEVEPRPYQHLYRSGNGIKASLIYLAIIWFFYFLDTWLFWLSLEDGQMATAAVKDGDWWLTITALTLHADFPHILANSVSGAFFGYFAARYMGSGLAWFMIVVCGALGNYLNAWIRIEDVLAIGASTGCFAAAGLVAGFVWRKSFIRGGGVRRNYMPIAAAIGIFAFMGVSGESTDVVGHLMGLLTGLLGGAILGLFDVRRLGQSGQSMAGYGAVIIVLSAWILAIFLS